MSEILMETFIEIINDLTSFEPLTIGDSYYIKLQVKGIPLLEEITEDSYYTVLDVYNEMKKRK